MLVAARTLKVDRVSGEVIAALEKAGIPCVLLKGPVLAAWLYDDGTPRMYSDTDVLVPHEKRSAAIATLESLGFEDYSPSGIPEDRPLHALTFVRPGDRAHLDLHTTLRGVGASSAAAWREFSSSSEVFRVGGLDVRIPSRRALALHVVLHAAQHGALEPRPMEDLRRALERVDRADWEGAAAMARALDALGPFSVGLGLLPAGELVRDELGLNEIGTDVITRLRAASPPHVAKGFEWLASRRGARAKARFVVLKLFPPPRFMRVWTPLARRGIWGLALSYPWRLLWLARHAPAGFRAWLRARG